MYHPEQSLGQNRQPRIVDRTFVYWHISQIGGYIVSGTFGYSKVYLMQFHYDYPHYYLPLERNQDNGRVVRKRIPLELTAVLPQEQTKFLPQEFPLKRREVNFLVAPWYQSLSSPDGMYHTDKKCVFNQYIEGIQPLVPGPPQGKATRPQGQDWYPFLVIHEGKHQDQL